MKFKVIPERKLDEIRGKMLVERASAKDFYGTEGWQHEIWG